MNKRAIYAIPTVSLLLAGCGAVCGDGKTDEGEECDDGNAVDTDSCTNACLNAACGDSIVEIGVEECDDGNTIDNDTCTNECTNGRCGDGIVFDQAGGDEECDDANQNNNDACLNNCQNAVCGDGVVQANVEECDDANQVNTDGCLNVCDLDPIIANFEITLHRDVPLNDVASFQLCTAYGGYGGCYGFTNCSRSFEAPFAVDASLDASGSYNKARICEDANFTTNYNTPVDIVGSVTVIDPGARYSISLTEGTTALVLDCDMDANSDLTCVDNGNLDWVITAQ